MLFGIAAKNELIKVGLTWLHAGAIRNHAATLYWSKSRGVDSAQPLGHIRHGPVFPNESAFPTLESNDSTLANCSPDSLSPSGVFFSAAHSITDPRPSLPAGAPGVLVPNCGTASQREGSH